MKRKQGARTMDVNARIYDRKKNHTRRRRSGTVSERTRPHLPQLQQVHLAQPRPARDVAPRAQVLPEHPHRPVARPLVGPPEEASELHLGGVQVQPRVEEVRGTTTAAATVVAPRGGGGGGGLPLVVVGQSGVGDVGPRPRPGRFDAGLLLPRVGGVGSLGAALPLREGGRGLLVHAAAALVRHAGMGRVYFNVVRRSSARLVRLSLVARARPVKLMADRIG